MNKTISIIFSGILLTQSSVANAVDACSDTDATAASESLAQSFFQQSELFEKSRVLKEHSPSHKKEVVSYVKTQDRSYSIFTLVNTQCEAYFVKRTRQND